MQTIQSLNTLVYSSFGDTNTNFWIAQLVFLITGFINNITVNQIDSMGAGDTRNGMVVLALYVGQFLSCLCFPSELKTFDIRVIRRVWKILVLDITSAVLYYMSLEFIGSGMATVLYSFIVVWTALIKRIFFGTKISIGRWISIVAMPCFISLSAVEQVKDNKNSKWRQLIGCILILISSLGYACTFCLNNALLANHAETKKTSSSTRSSSMNESLLNRNQKHDDDDERDFSVHPTPTHVATIISMNGLLVLLYMSIFVFPNWSEYMFNDQNKGSTTNAWHYGSTEYTALFYTVFVISVGAHQQSVYHCLCHGASSAVTAGVSKSLQAAGTFMLSALIFCKTEHDQCLNVWKIVGMIGIVFTVLWYSVIDVIIPRRRDEDDEIVTHLSTPALSVYEGSHSDDDNDDGEA